MADGKGFVDRIDMILKQKNRKRLALAEEIGLSVQTFTDWKRRDSIPSADIALQISKYLNVPLEWLITGEETNPFQKSSETLPPPHIIELAKDIYRLPEEYQDIIRNNVEAYKALCLKLEKANSLGIG